MLTPNAIHRFVFVPRGRGLSFYVTFVLDQSGERACAMWEQSVFSVQMAGKGRKNSARTNSKLGRASSSCPKDLQQRNRLKFVQFACTVPTQPKLAPLSAIETIRYKRFITRSG